MALILMLCFDSKVDSFRKKILYKAILVLVFADNSTLENQCYRITVLLENECYAGVSE